MQGEAELFQVYIYSGTALGLFLCALVLQRSRIRRLEDQLDDVTLKFQRQAASPKSVSHELFHACPYPVCYLSLDGTIQSSNPAFERLAGKKVGSLSALDDAYGTRLHHLSLRGTRFSHHQVVFKRGLGSERHFHLLLWPVWGPHSQLGTMLTLHEQTHVLRRRQNQSHFEQQLVDYTAFIGSQIDQLIKSGGTDALQLVHAYSEEMNLLSHYLTEIHGAVRKPITHSTVDIATVSRTVIDELRPEWRRKNLHLVSSFPVHCSLFAHTEDIALLLRTVFAATFLQAESGQEVRYEVLRDDSRIILEWSIPDSPLDAADETHAFSFGSKERTLKQGSRIWRLHVAIAREILNRHNGTFAITSSKKFGTSYRATLVASVKE